MRPPALRTTRAGVVQITNWYRAPARSAAGPTIKNNFFLTVFLIPVYWTHTNNKEVTMYTIYANSGRDEKIIRQVPATCLPIYLDHLKATGHEIMVLREGGA